MKAYITIISMSLYGIILLSCQSKKYDLLLIEAQGFHQQAGHIRENLSKRISDAEVESLMRPILQEYKQAIKEWDEAWVEVPGYEHDHGEEGHDHHHHTVPKLTAKEHLELQKHLLEEIMELEKSFIYRLKGIMN